MNWKYAGAFYVIKITDREYPGKEPPTGSKSFEVPKTPFQWMETAALGIIPRKRINKLGAIDPQ